MRKTKLNLRKVKVKRGKKFEQYYCVTLPKLGGGRTRRYFACTKEGKSEADSFLSISQTQQQNYGTAALTLTPGERAEYLECCEALKPFGKKPRDAVAFYLPHLVARNRSCTAKEMVAELLRVKAADGLSERYIADLRHRLGVFAAEFDGKPLADITARETDEWLRGLSCGSSGDALAAATRNNFRRVLVVAFNFARERGYCTMNPAAGAARAKEIESPVGILSPAETASFLEASPADLVPHLAIGAFAGLRQSEIERLDWRDIDLESGFINVTAATAKTARRRLVKIQDNLAAWLRPYARSGGPVDPPRPRELWDAARRSIGFGTPGSETEGERQQGVKLRPWPDNALRHSFASYHLAKFNDVAALALQMGNSPNMIFRHYREVVRPREAETYWSIKPGSAENLLAMAAA